MVGSASAPQTKTYNDWLSKRRINSVLQYFAKNAELDKWINGETKKIVIATYSMASEGLDIKSLTTLIMATPKTDIEQAVGRIRPKVGVNPKNAPLVIDIVDDFSLFSRQADKRYSFYKKKNYFIETFRASRDGKTIVKTETWEPDNEDDDEIGEEN